MQSINSKIAEILICLDSEDWKGALQVVKNLMGVDACCLRMVSSTSLVLIDSIGIPEHQLHIRFSVLEPLPRRVLSSDDPMIVEDVFENPLTSHRAQMSVVSANKYFFRTFFGVPLKWEGNTIGILGLYKREARHSVDRLIEKLRLLAMVFSLAVSHHRSSGLLRDQFAEIIRLKREARTDPLTNLMNRRAFEETAEKEIARARRHKTQFSFAFLDIDNFKLVNDTFGHEIGDRVLVQLASLLHSRIRRYDHAARWGGEEFVILFPGIASETALRIADDIRESVEEGLKACIDPIPETPITCSIGVTALLPEDNGLRDLIVRSDKALYSSKGAGGNCCNLEKD